MREVLDRALEAGERRPRDLGRASNKKIFLPSSASSEITIQRIRKEETDPNERKHPSFNSSQPPSSSLHQLSNSYREPRSDLTHSDHQESDQLPHRHSLLRLVPFRFYNLWQDVLVRQEGTKDGGGRDRGQEEQREEDQREQHVEHEGEEGGEEGGLIRG